MSSCDLSHRTEPIRGIKHANITAPDGTLHPLSFPNSAYGVGEMRAWCAYRGVNPYYHAEPAPHYNCECGFYAWKPGVATRMRAVKRMSSQLPLLDVELYGRVIEHELGYRAEYQRVVKIWVPNDWAGAWAPESLRSRYSTEIDYMHAAPDGHPLSLE